MLGCQTCPGDGSCTECNAIAIDTSHLTFLARAAQRLERAELQRDELLFRLVQVTACFRADRLVTAEAMFDREIDPRGENSRVLGVLGVDVLEDGTDWSVLIARARRRRADELTLAAARIHQGDMDCELLGHSLAEADERSVRLVTNDENLRVSAIKLLEHLRRTDRAPKADFMVIDSVDLMKRLVGCRAISMDVMEGALLAEWDHVSERDMDERKRRKKLDRLLRIAREVEIQLPDPDRPFDDSEIFDIFLDKADEHGP